MFCLDFLTAFRPPEDEILVNAGVQNSIGLKEVLATNSVTELENIWKCQDCLITDCWSQFEVKVTRNHMGSKVPLVLWKASLTTKLINKGNIPHAEGASALISAAQ